MSEKILIFDIETASTTGAPDALTDKLRFFGCYSYLTNKYYYLTEYDEIRTIIKEHDCIVGFNNFQYDAKVMYYNGFTDIVQQHGENFKFKYKINIDMFDIFKKRAGIMKIKAGMLGDLLMSYSLDYISQTIGVVDKSTKKIENFDYSILNKSQHTQQELKYIIDYLQRDLEVTKKMYDWLEEYFKGFKDFLTEEDVRTKKYLTSSPAVFTYKAVCKATGLKEEYSDGVEQHKNFGGAFVSYPAGEHFSGNIYCFDYNSLYPSIMHQCNIYSPAKPEEEYWNGNGFFDVEGKYKSNEQGKVEKLLKKFYEQRLEYKRLKDAREYSIKIIINCFDKDTQCVTVNDGIKYIKDCKIGDLVYSINPVTYDLEIKPIIEVTKRKYNGIMHEYNSPYYNFKITPEHKLLLEKQNGKKYSKAIFIKSKDIEDCNYRLPKCNGKLPIDIDNFSFLSIKNRREYKYHDYIYNVMVKNNHTLLAGSNNKFNWIGQTTYGVLGNESFKNLSNPVAAGDVTRLGRQWVKLARKMFKEAGYGIIYTDSVGKDSIIRTNYGNYTIEELFNRGIATQDLFKERVILNDCKTLTLNNNKKVIYDKIESIVRHKTSKRIYEVVFNNQEKIVVTEDHSFIWFDDQGNFISKKPSELKHVISLSSIPYKCKQQNIFSDDELKFLGLWMGDGAIYKTTNSYFSLSTGLDTKELQKKVINKVFSKYNISKTGYDLVFCDVKYRRKMAKYGFIGTSKTKNIPNIIFSLPPQQIGYFLAGYFTADGFVNSSGIGLASISKHLMEQVRDLLLQLNITSTIKLDTHANSYKGKYSGTYNYILRIKEQDKFKEKVGFIVDRKQNKIKVSNNKYFAPLSIRKQIRYKDNRDYTGELIIQKGNEGKYIDVPVRRIQQINQIEYDDYVYDIETKSTHKFFANDILVHNTDSVYVIDPFHDKERMLQVKNQIIETIKANVPFPYENFDMGIDEEITDMWFFKGSNQSTDNDETDTDESYSDEEDLQNKKLNLMKKNYIFLTKDGQVKVKNLGVRKKSTSALTLEIFWQHLVPKIKQERKVTFPKSWFSDKISELLHQDLKLAAKRYKVFSAKSYKNASQIQSQIAKKYGEGIHFLIPNKKFGVGKGKKYCTIEEFNSNNLQFKDIDLQPVWNELDYFIEKVPAKPVQKLFDFV